MRRWIVLFALSLLIAACGGSDVSESEFSSVSSQLAELQSSTTTLPEKQDSESAATQPLPECLQIEPVFVDTGGTRNPTVLNPNPEEEWDISIAAGEVAVLPIEGVGSVAISFPAELRRNHRFQLPGCYRAGQQRLSSQLYIAASLEEVSRMTLLQTPVVHYRYDYTPQGVQGPERVQG